MFRLSKQEFLVLFSLSIPLANIGITSGNSKCISSRNQQMVTQPTFF